MKKFLISTLMIICLLVASFGCAPSNSDNSTSDSNAESNSASVSTSASESASTSTSSSVSESETQTSSNSTSESASKSASYEDKNEKMVIAVPDGAPAVAVYNVMKNGAKLAGYDVEINVLSGAENIATVMTSGQADAAIMPTNVAAKLFNKGVKLKLASVNVFGVLYMVGKTAITSPSDLVGKTICNIGRGGSPDLTLKLILDKNNVPYEESEEAVSGKVALSYVSAGPEAIQKLASSKCDYIILGEPVVTQSIKAVSGAQVVMNLSEEWSKVVGENSYMQAGLVLSDSASQKTDFVKELTNLLKANAEVLKTDYSMVKGVLSNGGSSLKVDFTLDTVQRLNIGYLSATEAKTALEKYYTAALEYDSTFIGGKLPADGFYLG